MFLRMNKKLHIATSRAAGKTCIDYAAANTPTGYELCETMQECDIFISVMYDQILKKDFLNKRRCYNFHAGLLPDYRGVGISSWVILNGEKETGVTLHEIDAGLDTGPIIARRKFPVTNTSTANSLYRNSMHEMINLFKDYFVKIITGNYKSRTVKKKPNSLYTRKMLDDARDITRLMRATYFPGKEGLFYYDATGNKNVLDHD